MTFESDMRAAGAFAAEGFAANGFEALAAGCAATFFVVFFVGMWFSETTGFKTYTFYRNLGSVCKQVFQ